MGRAKRSCKAEVWVIRSLLIAAMIAAVLSFDSRAWAQTASPSPAGSENATPTPDTAILLTIFLKHDQSRPLGELNAQLERQGFYKAFPPPGVEVVSWYVMMGVGQVVTLRLPASLASRSQPHLRNHGLGQLPDRVLPDLRLQGCRHRQSRQGADKVREAQALDG